MCLPLTSHFLDVLLIFGSRNIFDRISYNCPLMYFIFLSTGIDALLWQQAKLDNPDPEKLIPVPMIGFNELYKRLKHQEQQTNLHQARMDVSRSTIEFLP